MTVSTLGDLTSFKWATVRAAPPTGVLSIQIDGDSAPLALIPDSLVDPMTLNNLDRVRVELSVRKCIIHGRAGGAFSVISMPSSIDLNTLNTAISTGFYVQGTNANATLANNYPVANVAGMLDVQSNGIDTVQRYHVRTGSFGDREYIRSGRSGTWTAWRQVALSGQNGVAFASAAGSGSVAAVAAGGNVNVTVTFPAGRFSQPPVVDAIPENARLTTAASSITTTSAVISFSNWSPASTGSTIPFRWTATQQTESSTYG